MSDRDQFAAHEDCKALHVWPEPYLLTFMGADGLTGHAFGRGHAPWSALDHLDFLERQVLASLCQAIVRKVDALNAREAD